MKFRHEQIVNAPMARVVSFFGDAANLPRVSPRFPAMSILGERTAIVPGAAFTIRLSAGPLAAHWQGVIESVAEDGSFVDSHSGPLFRAWRHTHRFEPVGEDCRLIDEIDAEPVWWFSPFAGMMVRGLFRVRRGALEREFQ
jgi:ligand-binding SRPBCC domain-containing protein